MSNPTASVAASVQCHKCGTKITATIDQLHAAEWVWYSCPARRYFWCKACSVSNAGEYNECRKVATVARQKAEADPHREEKLKARAGGVTDAN